MCNYGGPWPYWHCLEELTSVDVHSVEGRDRLGVVGQGSSDGRSESDACACVRIARLDTEAALVSVSPPTHTHTHTPVHPSWSRPHT